MLLHEEALPLLCNLVGWQELAAFHMLRNQGSRRLRIPADFKQALGQQSSTGPAPPSKLTTHQTQIVKALIEAHGDDVEVLSHSFHLVPVLLATPSI